MEIKENPCNGVTKKYLVRGPNNSLVGCLSPQKVDCTGSKPGETCNCIPGTQNCAFDECSVKEFNIPSNLMNYLFRSTFQPDLPTVKVAEELVG